LLHRNESTQSAHAHSVHHSSVGISPPCLLSRAREEKPAGGSGLALVAPVVKALCDFSSRRQDVDSSHRIQLGFFSSPLFKLFFFFTSLDIYVFLAAVTDSQQPTT
ncbi:hypothetical protein E3U43_005560, partial [Larimichthys crocea]